MISLRFFILVKLIEMKLIEYDLIIKNFDFEIQFWRQLCRNFFQHISKDTKHAYGNQTLHFFSILYKIAICRREFFLNLKKIVTSRNYIRKRMSGRIEKMKESTNRIQERMRRHLNRKRKIHRRLKSRDNKRFFNNIRNNLIFKIQYISFILHKKDNNKV